MKGKRKDTQYVYCAAVGDADAFKDNAGLIAGMMILYGLSVIPFSYLMTFVLKKAETASSVMLTIFILTGMGLLGTSSALESIESTQDLADELKFIFRLFPNFCVGRNFYELGFGS